jgi:uncharacterized caspase-like protein
MRSFVKKFNVVLLVFITFPLFSGISIGKPKIHIISIGVDEFLTGNFNLEYCVADAKSFYDSFPEIEVENKVLLTNEYATKDNIIKHIENTLSRMSEIDCLMLYVATHGLFDTVDYYFTPYDFDFENYGLSGISSNWLIEILSNAVQYKSNNIIVFLDTCHSGAVGFDIRKSYNINSQTGLALLYSCSPLELSLEGLEYGGHGLFTYGVLNGLTGKADKNGDGNITFRELFDYTYYKVKELSNDEQNPVFIGAMKNSMILK